jgi:hypothetical protein
MATTRFTDIRDNGEPWLSDPAEGITGIVGGPGITVTGPPTAPIITNTGVRTVTAGTGVTNTGTATDPVLNNAGVLSVVGGIAIGVSGATGNVTIDNNGVRTLTVQDGIGFTGASTNTNPIIFNSGVRSITAGAGVTLGGTANDPVINAGVGTTTTIVSSDGSIVVGGAAPAYDLAAPRVLNTFAGTTNMVAVIDGARTIPNMPWAFYEIQFYPNIKLRVLRWNASGAADLGTWISASGERFRSAALGTFSVDTNTSVSVNGYNLNFGLGDSCMVGFMTPHVIGTTAYLEYYPNRQGFNQQFNTSVGFASEVALEGGQLVWFGV